MKKLENNEPYSQENKFPKKQWQKPGFTIIATNEVEVKSAPAVREAESASGSILS